MERAGRFAADPTPNAALGLVYGRRRQGKTLMLELLTEATGGFMFTAREQSDRQNRDELSAAYARHARLPASRHTHTRLILCGGAMSVMRDLLGGGAPLRGSAPLELVLQPFSYREAASFWQLADDPELAFPGACSARRDTRLPCDGVRSAFGPGVLRRLGL